MRKKIYLASALMLTMALAAPPSVYAQEYTTEVTNNVTLGDISIGLSEYELDENGNEVPYKDNKVVAPGEVVDNIVRLTNRANSCWLRMKAEYTSESGLDSITDDDLVLASDKWEKIGGYYYYKEPLAREETVDFIKKVKIPTEWTSNYAGKKFSIIMTADAVQEANFDPDWNSEDPWFGTVIEACVHTSYDPRLAKEDVFSVAFENGADGLVRVGDDFFSNWKDLMPGDEVSGIVTFKNNYARTITMYFRTETIADDDLLKALLLEIKNGDEVIYSGTMDGRVKDNVKVAVLSKDQDAALTYTVKVPKELNNKYALSATKTKWIFTADLPRSSGGSGGGHSGGSSSGSTSPGGPGVTPTIAPSEAETQPAASDTSTENIGDNDTATGRKDGDRTNPKTGDDSQVGLYLMFTGLFGCGAIGMIIAGKKQKKKGEKDREK